jgi:hypothetical protein
MSRPLLLFTIAFGVLFIGGLTWFVVRANTRAPGEPAPGPSELFDTDVDGLTDAAEERLGTNPSDDDSDHDGLSDADEVSTYRTNPLVGDSDGDGFLDGVEVRGGYDPLSPVGTSGPAPSVTSTP